MSEPTARDMEAARLAWARWQERVELFPPTPDDWIDLVAALVAAERARVLTLTPEEAGRLWRIALGWDERDPVQWSERDALAFLAALTARAEGTG